MKRDGGAYVNGLLYFPILPGLRTVTVSLTDDVWDKSTERHTLKSQRNEQVEMNLGRKAGVCGTLQVVADTYFGRVRFRRLSYELLLIHVPQKPWLDDHNLSHSDKELL